ncbi:MAG: winged helix-turn-helix domain-containing protein, partial [Pseudomonadota bacterium]|nr:winged helix-turn-helix domain-containing protein [Pseudomonadota bacterium]
MTRYEEVAATLRERIEHGIYRVGDRLPSIRAVCQELNVSISTAQEAYRQLMDAALIESRPKSGYFVLPCRIPSVLPSVSRP